MVMGGLYIRIIRSVDRCVLEDVISCNMRYPLFIVLFV
jgi:hypothetical protein